MHVDVSTEIVIDAPLETVAEYAMEPENAPRWYENIKSVEWKTPPPVRVGSKVAFVAEFLGRRMAYTYEVVALDPRRRLVMRTAQGPFPMETIYLFEQVEEGRTRMRLRNRGTPSGFSRWMAPIMALAMRRANRKDLALLKRQVETGRS